MISHLSRLQFTTLGIVAGLPQRSLELVPQSRESFVVRKRHPTNTFSFPRSPRLRMKSLLRSKRLRERNGRLTIKQLTKLSRQDKKKWVMGTIVVSCCCYWQQSLVREEVPTLMTSRNWQTPRWRCQRRIWMRLLQRFSRADFTRNLCKLEAWSYNEVC